MERLCSRREIANQRTERTLSVARDVKNKEEHSMG